jgi:hypothetical protein
VTVEEEIRQVDAQITKLKIQFDLYFIGSVPKPPTDQRDALDKQVKKLQFNLKTSGDRFLYNAVLNKFNAYSELWLKNLRIKEEGIHLHPLARRHARQMADAATRSGGSNGPSSPGTQKVARHKGGAQRGEHRPAESWRISTTSQDDAALRSFYQNFVAAKTRAGDPKTPSFDAFAREIARHAAAIKGKVDCDTIDFTIYSRDSKVSIKAKPLK